MLLFHSQVQTPELAEVFAINAMSPFILNGKLKALMCRGAETCVSIVNSLLQSAERSAG